MPAAPSLAEHIAERLAAHQNAFKEELQLLRNARGDRAIDQALAQFREEELREAVEARTGMQARPRRAPLPWCHAPASPKIWPGPVKDVLATCPIQSPFRFSAAQAASRFTKSP